MAAGVIELGLDRTLPDLDAGGPSWRTRRARIVVGLACVVALTLGSSAAPKLPPFEGPAILRGAVADRAVVLADRVHLISAGTGNRRLSTFALPSGRHLWTVPFHADGQLARVVRSGGTVLVATYEPHLGRGRAFAFDADKGWPLWQSDAWTVDPVDDGSFLLLRRGVAGLPPGTASQVVSLDGRTGQPRWSGAVQVATRFERVGGAGGLRWAVTIPADSNVAQVWDLRTGAVVARGPVSPAGTTLLDLQAVGGTVLSRYTVPGGTVHWLAAYAVDTLALQWVVRAPSTREFYPADCGSLVCVGADGAVTAIDQRSGALVWQAAYHQMSGAGERLFAQDRQGRLALVASDTGRSVRILPEWEVLGPIGPDARRYLVARSTEGTSQVWFGVLDPARAAVRTLGTASGVLGSTCRPGAGSVVCELINGGVGVWAVRA